MSKEYKIGVQLTPTEIQVVHKALTYYLQTGQDANVADIQLKLLKELADVFKRIITMEEM